MVFFNGILIAMTFGDGAFGILNAFGGEQFPKEARGTGLGLGYSIGASSRRGRGAEDTRLWRAVTCTDGLTCPRSSPALKSSSALRLSPALRSPPALMRRGAEENEA